MLVIVILLMAVLLIYLLFGKAIGEKLGWGQDPSGSEPSGAVSSQGSSGTSSSGASGSGASSSGEEPVVDPEPAGLTYEAALALPDGLTLSKTDYSTNVGDPDVTLSVSGGSGSYTWLSENDAIAAVSESGTVTAVANGTVNILVTDGNQKAVSNVREKGGSDPVTPAVDPGPTGGSLKLGAATVINAPAGVNVRSGPGTENAAIASLVNGNEVTIKADAGNGWYEITFVGNGGVDTDGYVKGEFLANK